MTPELKQDIYSWVSCSVDVRPVTNGHLQSPNRDSRLVAEHGGKRRYRCVKVATGKLPYRWFPKPPVLYSEVFDCLDIQFVVDLNSGSGGRIKSSFILKEKHACTSRSMVSVTTSHI